MAKQTGYQLRTPRTSVRQAKTGICRQVARRSVRGSLELPPIGWQLFLLGNSKSDSTAFPSFLDTYATRLLAEPLRPKSFRRGVHTIACIWGCISVQVHYKMY